MLLSQKITNKNHKPLRFSLQDAFPKQKKSALSILSGCVLSSLLFVGFGCCLYSIGAAPSYEIPLVMLGLLAAVTMSICWTLPKVRIIASILLFVFIAGVTVALFADVTDGINLAANHISSLWGAQTGRIQPLLEVSVAEGSYTFVTTLFLVPLTALLAYLCSYLAYRMSAALSLFLTALTIFCAWILASYPPFWAFALLIFAQVLLFTGRYSAQSRFSGRYTVAQYAAQAGAAAASLALLVVFGLGMSDEYQVPESVVQTREAIVATIDRARFGVDTSTGMPDGDFSDLGDLELSDDTALEVSMESPESLWLRGYIGSEYTGFGWKDTAKETLHENESLFYWFHADNFYGQTQLASIATHLDSSVVDTTSATSVSNVGASSRNIYAPYEVFWAERDLLAADGIGDAFLYSEGFFGNRQYGYLTVANQVKRYPDLMNLLYEQEEKNNVFLGPYFLDESYYAQYAHNQYLHISDELRAFLDDYFTPYLTDENEASYSTYKEAVISCLTADLDYSANPTNEENAQDFIISFLDVSKAGYSVHYASAATMMFRYCGVPARYVEGYLITPHDVNETTESSTLVLDGTHAHAWTEIYINGIGWIPVEVTPPYFGLMEEPDSYEGVPGAANDDLEKDSSDGATEEQADSQITNVDTDEELLPGIVVLLLLLIALLIAGILWWLIRRKRSIAARQRLINGEDNVQAILAMFTYIMALFHARGLPKEHIWLIKHLQASLEKVDTQYSPAFPNAFALYEEAAYSCSGMSDDKRERMREFKDEILAETREKSSLFRTIKIRFVLCLY